MLLAIPHLIIVIGYAAGVVAWVGFWIVAFTGSFPPGLHRFFHAYLSWVARTAAWLGSVVDQYPPFDWDDGGEPATA